LTTIEFETVVRQQQGMVFSIACNFFHNPAVAEEVAQDVFLQLFQNRRAVQPGAHCIAWLRRTTVHRCIDTRRHSNFRQEMQMDPLPDVPADCRETDPLLYEGLRRLVASLPETPRSVLILRFGEDMDADDIGRVLQMPVRTVWSHLQRAIALLKEKTVRYLKEKEDEPVRTRSS
jgi:RNA polymerase sigma-70 factor (ECF subfamily)